MSNSAVFEWEKMLPMDDLVRLGEVKLGRGNVISKIDIRQNPGPYPIYSSSSKNHGKMGEYGRYMFDEEMISWSVDGGGYFFYRPKHKFSVTNVSGFMRLSTNWDYRFIAYSLQFQHEFFSFDYQTKAHPSVIREFYTFPKITLNEQQKIATILSSIDNVIQKKHNQIHKLKDLKNGMVQELLTRGIGHTEFKSSPVGLIPKKWSISNAGKLADEIMVGVVIKPSQYYVEKGVPALRSANVRESGLTKNNLKYFSKESNDLLKKSKLLKGDLLTVRTGYPGVTAVVTEDFEGCNCIDVVITRPSKEMDSNFFSLWVNSDNGRGQVLKAQGGLAQQHFNVADMRNLLVPVPPIDEQREIFEAINAVISKISLSEKKLHKATILKTALMQDLLTGKVRVNAENFQKERMAV